jgi:hypothetical protein
MRKLTCLMLCNLAPVAWGQTASPPNAQTSPVHVSRVPPKTASEIDLLQGQISADPQALQGGVSNTLLPNLTVATPGAHVEATAVPKDFHPRSDMPLTPTAQAAVKVSERWLTEASTPSPRPDRRVVYTYGAGLPTVVQRQEQSMIPAPDPRRLVRDGEDRIDLLAREIRNHRLCGSLARNGHHSVHDGYVCWISKRDNPEEGPYRVQTGVSGSRLVAALCFQIV